MIEIYKPKFSNDVLVLLNSIVHDFYITENNIRQYIKTEGTLKKLIRQATNPYVLFEKGDCVGIILQWKSLGALEPRFYVKLGAINPSIADKLLTNLLWHTNKDLFIKLKKESPLMRIFKNKGFEYRGNRGNEILMYRKYKGK
jgi:hypothetical protein